jgi:hypothetical protein
MFYQNTTHSASQDTLDDFGFFEDDLEDETAFDHDEILFESKVDLND